MEGWGGASNSVAYVFRPSTFDEVRSVFELARQSGRTVAFRGAGRSYGDAALNAENAVLDLTRLNRILAWDPAGGTITLEPGVTIRQLWEYVLPHGWWPPVVPGTMYPTLGGCLAMNIHGKNNYREGPIGDHVTEFDLLLPNGDLKRCSRTENVELFDAAVGGFGILGCFTRITLRMKRIYSGLLNVEAITARSLDHMVEIFEQRTAGADYLVGWIDALAGGSHVGRGVIHAANYLAEGADPHPERTLRVESQQLPDRILGILPKSMLWRLMRPFMNNTGVRVVNGLKYHASALLDRGRVVRQSHVEFAFLLDYVPNWKQAYGTGGLIQYQSFIPREHAADVFRRQLVLAQEAGFPPYLAVFKRHRADRFLMTHGVDGYSLALDFRITPRNRRAIWDLAAQLDEIVLASGGRFYFAKDSTLQAQSVEQYLGSDAVERFMRLKRECDPEGILETNLYRRLFGARAGDQILFRGER
ncbi:MAG: FAD-binding oxidoreductase [Bacteroidetes bacterium]|nr:FAD-binding oxidoreductase [Bacteroidota bacterium]